MTNNRSSNKTSQKETYKNLKIFKKEDLEEFFKIFKNRGDLFSNNNDGYIEELL